MQDHGLSNPHCPKGLDIDTEEPSPRVPLLEKGYGASEVDSSIRSLLEKQLMIRVDQRLLALAIEEPYLDYISPDQNPMGWVNY